VWPGVSQALENVAWVVLRPETGTTALRWTTLGRGSAPMAEAGREEEVPVKTTCFSFSPFSPQKISPKLEVTATALRSVFLQGLLSLCLTLPSRT